MFDVDPRWGDQIEFKWIITEQEGVATGRQTDDDITATERNQHRSSDLMKAELFIYFLLLLVIEFEETERDDICAPKLIGLHVATPPTS